MPDESRACSIRPNWRPGDFVGPVARHRLSGDGQRHFSFVGVGLGRWIGYLIAGFIGACSLIWIVRAVRVLRMFG